MKAEYNEKPTLREYALPIDGAIRYFNRMDIGKIDSSSANKLIMVHAGIAVLPSMAFLPLFDMLIR